ncbi:calcium-binding protein [Acidovorax sp. DW039]|uniref:calcium-binding protein n=1 Tax=Acidovorax sp. DW039 TaxID=3095606 RepID=UPI00308D93F5|nr:calcium-binding protein [Acidovorax sp. DW039]
MTTISSVSSAWSSASVQRASRPGPSPERLLSKIDADGSGGVDSTELQGLLDKVAKKTGVTGDTSASDLLTQFDANGDGNLNADELGKTMESLMPARSTMDFAQARSADASSSASNATSASSAKGQAGDDLFGKVDSDGDGSVSKTELQALLEAMSGGTASKTGVSSDDAFAALDADGDGSLSQAEFDAGRPSGDGPQAGGMPPPGGPGGPGGAGGPRGAGGAQASSESTTYDPLDTNEDGVVSIAERLAGSSSTSGQDAITALFNAIDTDGDQSISSAESQSFIDQLTSQLKPSASNASGQSSSSNKDGSQSTDLARLADFARQQYARAANDWSASSRASTLSAVA